MFSMSFVFCLITHSGYVVAPQKQYSSFHDVHYLLRRTRRSNETWFSKHNETGCSDGTPNINCTITETHVDNHEYYRSTYFPNGASLFLEISRYAKDHNLTMIKHEKLSASYKKGVKISLGFLFPFYGNYVDNIVVTTGGFINIGPKFHAFINQVHYIAPLMADFDPSVSNTSSIYIAKGDGIMITQWNNLRLKGYSGEKNFTFQVILYKNGTVIMAYKEIPISPDKIKSVQSYIRVTVGFADGFILTYKKHDSFRIIIHNLIYSYHKVNFPLNSIRDGVAYKLDLLPNCIQFNDCHSCLNESKYTTNFSCKWCPVLKQCSDALDWNRQRWLQKCDRNSYAVVEKCIKSDKDARQLTDRDASMKGNTLSGIVLGVLFFIVACIACGIFIYAYSHPLSKLGLCLVDKRPSKRFQKLTEEDFA